MRFSLRVLILLVTTASLFLGFNAWRRQQILNKSEYFKKYDIKIIVPNNLRDYIWQRYPHSALIRVPSEVYSPRHHALTKELAIFGIWKVTYQIGELEINWEDAIDDSPSVSYEKK
jgi:hypothetical protein